MEEYQCIVCKKKLATRQGLQIHMQHAHVLEENKHICKICRLIIKDDDEMLRHKELHDKMQKNQCVVCTKQFRTKHSLKYHAPHAHNKVT